MGEREREGDRVTHTDSERGRDRGVGVEGENVNLS